jgi:predicted transcriptional regulator
MRQTLTIRLPADLRKELQKISQEESKPMSDLVRESLQRYISVYKFRRLRNKVLPFAESQGILTDEDVFDEIS